MIQENVEKEKSEETVVDFDAIDASQTHQIAEFKYDVPLTTLRTDPTGRFAAAGAEDLAVQLWDLDSGQRRTLNAHKSWVRSIDFSSDGNRMFTACWGGNINVWDTGQDQPTPLLTIQAHRGAARFVRVSPDGTQLATCGNDLLVKVWNLADGKKVHEFCGHERHVYGVDFHPDGDYLVSQDLMGGTNVWDLKSGKRQRTVDASVMTGYDNKFAADMGGARDIQFKPDGRQWASAGITKVTNSFAGIQDPIIVLFDWETGKEVKQLKATDDNVKGIAWGVRFHPDNFIIGAIADRTGKGELWFYKPDEEKAFHTLKLPSAARGLDLLADNRRLAVAHADGHLRLYRMTAKPPAAEAPAEKTEAEKTG
jgi:WD40 repeat protein